MFWLASVGPVTSSEPGETLSPSNFDSQICWHVFFCWLAQKIWRFGRGYTDIWSSPVNFISQTFYRSELDDHYRPWARLSTLYWQSDHNYRRYILMRLSVVYFCIKFSWLLKVLIFALNASYAKIDHRWYHQDIPSICVIRLLIHGAETYSQPDHLVPI